MFCDTTDSVVAAASQWSYIKIEVAAARVKDLQTNVYKCVCVCVVRTCPASYMCMCLKDMWSIHLSCHMRLRCHWEYDSQANSGEQGKTPLYINVYVCVCVCVIEYWKEALSAASGRQQRWTELFEEMNMNVWQRQHCCNRTCEMDYSVPTLALAEQLVFVLRAFALLSASAPQRFSFSALQLLSASASQCALLLLLLFSWRHCHSLFCFPFSFCLPLSTWPQWACRILAGRRQQHTNRLRTSERRKTARHLAS